MNNKVLKCKIYHQTGEYTCVSGKKFNIRGKCVVSQKSKQGGLSILGNGGSYGSSNSDLKCHDDNDFRKKVEEKYNDFIVTLED